MILLSAANFQRDGSAFNASNNGAASLPLTPNDYFYGVAFSEAVTAAGSYNITGMTDAVANGTGATAKPFRNENANQLSGTVQEMAEWIE